MLEFREEHGPVDIDGLTSGFIPQEIYGEAHRGLVIPCHDVFIEHEGGVLLVHRKIHPAREILWPFGGRVQRGVPIEKSLAAKVKTESGLALVDIQSLGFARTYFRTDPFDHGRGTDTINFVYKARGKGSLQLDDLHEHVVTVRGENYSEVVGSLHPYVKHFMDKLLDPWM